MNRETKSPRYLDLLESGEIDKRVAALRAIYSECRLCPHECGIDRTAKGRGICRSGSHPMVASWNVHPGEEPPISGTGGSGTIFFSGCTGRCIFCQNYPISQLGTGAEASEERLAEMMLELQSRGCHNINFVTPTHFSPSVAAAIALAAARGLRIPIVYNTSGYERVEVLRLLDGIIDIYLPDSKYSDNAVASSLSGFQGYVEHNHAALKEMYRQVGELKTQHGLAIRGVIIRHLILPEGLAGTRDVLPFIAEEISCDVHISLMDQYFPAYHALNHGTMARRVTEEEYQEALEAFDASGLHNGWIQDHFAE
ncbi:MAG: radical SAM protein [Candidatus Latescibacterota bacterium]